MGTTKAIALLSQDKIAESFKIVSEQLDKFEQISMNITITDDETLAVAENNASQVKTMLTRVEAARVELKDPYYQTGLLVDQIAKGIKGRLEAFKQRFSLSITGWKSVQEAAEKSKLDAKKKELETIEADKTAEADKIVRLTRTVYARLYGGSYILGNGEEKISSGAYTGEDCDKLTMALHKSFPTADSFVYFPDRRETLYIEATKAIRTHKMSLIDLASDTPGVKNAAMKRIQENKLNAGLIVTKTNDVLSKKIAQETKKEVRAGEADVKEAAKGTRKILKFRVLNEEVVTREYLSVDSGKIREWMEGQNADIKQQLMQGNQPIPGVQFYVEETYVAR